MDTELTATIQHRDPAQQAGFTMLPNAILTAARLSCGARCLYGLLKMYAWQAEAAFPGQARLALDLGVSDRQVRTYMAELQTAGLITVEQRGLRQTNRYWIETIPAAFLSDRKPTSGLERNATSGLDRKPASDKEDSDGKKTQGKKREEPGPGTEVPVQLPHPAPAPAPLPLRPLQPVPKGTPIQQRPDRPPVVKAHPLPDPYPLTTEMRAWAAMELPALRDLDTEHKQFCRHWHAQANITRTHWRPMWEKWMTDAVGRFAAREARAPAAFSVTGQAYRVLPLVETA